MNPKKFSLKWICAAAAVAFLAACSSSDSGTGATDDGSGDITSSDAGNSSAAGTSSGSVGTSSDSDTSDDADDAENGKTHALSTSEWLKWDVPTSAKTGTFEIPDSAATVFLDGSTITVGNADDKEYTILNNQLEIHSAGVYVVSGTMADGRILVSVGDDENVELVLNGVNLGNSENAPIFFVNGNKIKLHLAEESINILSDASKYQFMEVGTYTLQDSLPKACVYAREDITIKGNGTLYVTGNYNNGIHTRADLVINDNPTIYVNAVNNALKGKKSVHVKDGGNYFLRTGDGSGISSDKEKTEAGVGVVSILAGNYKMDVGNAGVKATNLDSIAGGTFEIHTANGDGLHSTTVSVFDGNFTIESGDEGFEGTSTLNLNGGSAVVSKSSKPFVGPALNITGGKWFGLGGGYDSTSVLNASIYTANFMLPSEISKGSTVSVKSATAAIFNSEAGKNIASVFAASTDFAAETYSVTADDSQVCSFTFDANSKVTTTCAQ